MKHAILKLATFLLILQGQNFGPSFGGNNTFTGSVSVLNQYADCIKYGIVGDGVTDDSAHIQACINDAVANYGGVMKFPAKQMLVLTSLNLTNLMGGLAGPEIYGAGPGFNKSAYQAGSTEFLCSTGTAPCFDWTGTSLIRQHDFSMRSGVGAGGGTASTVLMLFGRDNAAGGGNGVFCFSQNDRMWNLQLFTGHSATINSNYGYVGIYNIGAEQFHMTLVRVVADTGMWFSANNDLSIASSYQTFATGCPASMNIVDGDMNEISVHSSTAAAMVLNGGGDYDFRNQFAIMDSGVTATPILLGGTISPQVVNGLKMGIHVEGLTSPGGLLKMSNSVHNLIFTGVLSSPVSTGNGAIQFANSPTCFDCDIRVLWNTLGSNETMLDTTATATFLGGQLWAGNTLSPWSNSNITFDGTEVHAENFAPANFLSSVFSYGPVMYNNGNYVTGANGWFMCTNTNASCGSIFNDTAGGIKIQSSGGSQWQFNSIGNLFTPGNITLHQSGALQFGASEDTGISRDSAGVLDFGNGTAGNKSGVVNAARFQPASITTVAGGTPAIVYNTASASVNANITAATMVTAPATNANCPANLTANCSVYEINWYIDVSAVGTSCTGSTTVVLNFLYTDPLGAGQQTVSTSTITIATNANGVAGTLVANGSQIVVAKLSTTVQYSTTSFTAGTGCSPAPKYQFTPIVKQLS